VVDARRGGTEQTDGMAQWPQSGQPSPADSGSELAERVADADRDRTILLLREHVVEGRLTLDEFSERVGLALEARTRGELDGCLVDLPVAGSEVVSDVPIRKARRWHVAVMSGSDTKGRWRISGKTNAVAVMGGCDLDLRRAAIEGPEVEISAFCFWGGIKITVPEGFDVELDGFSLMGGRSLKLRDVPRVPGSPRILIKGFCVMGGIDVRSKPNRTGKEILKSVLGGVQEALPEYVDGSGAINFSALGKDIRRQIRAELSGTGSSRPERPVAPPQGPSAPPMVNDGTVTILFSDMVDYAGMTERLGDHASRELLRQHHQIVRSMLDRHGGREINVQGDGFMVVFSGVARALRCAVDLQRAFRTYSQAHADQPIQVHIGIHTGDAVEEDDDYLGHTVIVASRLASQAEAGEIVVSTLSAQLVQGSGEFTFVGQRDTFLKGMSRPQGMTTLSWGD
jgi:class 3 adenylate cyclase